MQLVSFSIENYRSITKAYRLKTTNWTVLIGPNNEGKSNILRALATVLKAISTSPEAQLAMRARSSASAAVLAHRLFGRPGSSDFDYEWSRDYPVALQEKHPNGESRFSVEFALTPEEIAEFWSEVGSRLNGTLPIQVTMGPSSYGFRVAKQGRGAASLAKKSGAIAAFVAKRLDIEYIQAVRTAESARRVVEGMVDRALRTLERDADYKVAIESISALQQPMLDQISRTIKDTLTGFLPDVKAVTIRISEEARSTAMRRSCQIIVDDGTATDLRYKGDGVQSIAALSLMRQASERGNAGRSLILAIEEPESHLHSRAIHQLRQVLVEIAATRQVFMTTHNPLFVDRMQLSNNIIVSRNRAEPATSLKRIRDVLGVRASENLRHADVVLVTEGEDDSLLLRGLLADASPTLHAAFEQGTLTTDSLLGAGNLSYKLSLLRDALCVTHAFLDDDKAGRTAVEKALGDGLSTIVDVTMSRVPGSPEAEVEDMLDAASYTALIREKFGVDLTGGRFRGNRKWSDRVKAAFMQSGKPWTQQVEHDVKMTIAGALSTFPQGALSLHKRESFDALVAALEDKVKARMA